MVTDLEVLIHRTTFSGLFVVIATVNVLINLLATDFFFKF
jgi:hypothetical protein